MQPLFHATVRARRVGEGLGEPGCRPRPVVVARLVHDQGVVSDVPDQSVHVVAPS